MATCYSAAGSVCTSNNVRPDGYFGTVNGSIVELPQAVTYPPPRGDSAPEPPTTLITRLRTAGYTPAVPMTLRRLCFEASV